MFSTSTVTRFPRSPYTDDLTLSASPPSVSIKIALACVVLCTFKNESEFTPAGMRSSSDGENASRASCASSGSVGSYATRFDALVNVSASDCLNEGNAPTMQTFPVLGS